MFRKIFQVPNHSVKAAVIKAGKTVVETLEAETCPEELIQRIVTSAVMKDEDIHFLMTSFKRKYNTSLPLRIVPIVEENTLNVKRWAFVAGTQTKLIEAGGMDELLNQLTASIIDPRTAGTVGEILASVQE